MKKDCIIQFRTTGEVDMDTYEIFVREKIIDDIYVIDPETYEVHLAVEPGDNWTCDMLKNKKLYMKP